MISISIKKLINNPNVACYWQHFMECCMGPHIPHLTHTGIAMHGVESHVSFLMGSVPLFPELCIELKHFMPSHLLTIYNAFNIFLLEYTKT